MPQWKSKSCAMASSNSSPINDRHDLSGQTVVVIGGSSGAGLQTARLARAQGADIILVARNPDRLHRVGLELGAAIAAFDATDFDRLGRFFGALPAPVDHLLVSGPDPYQAPLAGFSLGAARRDLDAHLLLPVLVAKKAAGKIRPGGTLLFLGGTCGNRTPSGVAFTAALTAALSVLIGDLAAEIAPVRVSLISADRANGPMDIAGLAVHLMTGAAVTGATFGADGGRRPVRPG
jgi:NAD(P)-dependent dehydrogenase (short-subunit alcohol dehydrogenase family)